MAIKQNSCTELKLVVFDLDGTLIEPSSSWKYLHQKLGTWKRAKKNPDLFYAGKLSWEEWAKRDAKLWAGIESNDVRRIAQKCPRTKGAKKATLRLKENDLHVAIISGGISFFADEVAQELKISHVFSNKLHERNGILTGEVTVSVTATNKPELLLQLSKQLEISLRHVVSVGDDFTMIPLFKITGLSIAFNPSTSDVRKSANVVLVGQSLLDILPYILKNRVRKSSMHACKQGHSRLARRI